MEIKEKNKILLNANQFDAFPGTRYMGSKNKIISNIWEVLDNIDFDTIFDAFSGSGVVSYFLKSKGKKVISNDFLSFSHHISKSLVENSSVQLSADDIDFLMLNTENNRSDFIQKTFKGLYFTNEENAFLDNLRSNIDLLDNEYKKSLALSAISRACMKKRPRGIFTYIGHRYDDGRNDIKKDLKQHFLENTKVFNSAVFNNSKNNISYNNDVYNLNVEADVVYFDPPYLTPNSDNDYTRRYHFVEGLVKNWEGLEIQENTITKKFKRTKSLFDSKSTVYQAFEKLFAKYRDSILVISYSSNSLPNKEDMISMLKKYKNDVEVIEIDYTYSFGNQNHKIGNNANKVKEYIFVAH